MAGDLQTGPGHADAIVLFAHGARDPEWAGPFRRIQQALRDRLPSVEIELAFLEFMSPRLEESIGRLANSGRSNISLVPLFMAQGGHLKHDLPPMLDALRAQHPRVTIRLMPAVGDVDAILQAIVAWIVEARDRTPG